MTRVIEKLTREDTLTEALRMVSETLGDEPPTSQALRIIAGLKAMMPGAVPRVYARTGVDYLERLQSAVHGAWIAKHSRDATGPEHDAIAGIDTPLGRFNALTYRRPWKNGKIAWATEYYLNDEPVTIREINAAGLAQRPTTRNRKRA